MTEFKFAWEQKYRCPKCGYQMKYKPERTQEKGGVGVVNWYECSKCKFRTTGVFDLLKTR